MDKTGVDELSSPFFFFGLNMLVFLEVFVRILFILPIKNNKSSSRRYEDSFLCWFQGLLYHMITSMVLESCGTTLSEEFYLFHW